MNALQISIVFLLTLLVHASMAASPHEVRKALAKFNGTFSMDVYRHKLNDQERHKFDNVIVAFAKFNVDDMRKFYQLSSALGNMTFAEVDKMKTFGFWCLPCKGIIGVISTVIGDIAALTEDALQEALDEACIAALFWAGECRAATHKYLSLVFKTIKNDHGVVAEHVCTDLEYC